MHDELLLGAEIPRIDKLFNARRAAVRLSAVLSGGLIRAGNLLLMVLFLLAGMIHSSAYDTVLQGSASLNHCARALRLTCRLRYHRGSELQQTSDRTIP